MEAAAMTVVVVVVTKEAVDTKVVMRADMRVVMRVEGRTTGR